MNYNYAMIIAALVVGIGIGVAVDRAVVTTGQQGEPSVGQPSAYEMGPRASMEAGVDPRGMSKAGTRSHRDRNAVATIRRVSRQLNMSPIIGMDYEAMLQAYQAIDWMNPEEVQMALAELRSGDMNRNTTMLRQLLMGLWAKQDGNGAMGYAISLKQPMDKTVSVMSGLAGWMRQDPITAYQWYKDNRGELGAGLKGGMQFDGLFISHLASQDMDAAFMELKELKGHNWQVALNTMAANMGREEVTRQRFIDQLEKLDDPSLKESGMNSMINSWAMTDPQGAIGYLEKMNPKPENYESLMDSAESRWGMTDPEGAIQWQLKNIDEGEVAGDKISNSFGRWVSNNPDEATKWLSEQPEGFATDKLYSDAARIVSWSEPKSATQWAVKIQDKHERRKSLSIIHANMKGQGEEAIQKWKEGLDPELREEVEGFK